MAIPLPQVVPDVGPGGGIVTAMRGMNALTQSNLQNEIARAQAKYAPYNAYADALSKIAYAQMGPANAIAQMLSGPGASNLTREQTIALGTQMQNLLKGYNQNNVLPPPNMMSQGNGNGLLGILMNKLIGNQQSNAGVPMPNNALNANPSGGSSEYGAINQASPDYVTNVANNGNGAPPLSTPTANLPFGRTAAQLAIPGSQGGATPAAGAHATQAAMDTGATTEAANLANAWNDQFKQSTSDANGARASLNILDKLQQSYTELGKLEKGPVKGNLPAFTTASQDFDKTQVALADSVAKAQQSGHITGKDREVYSSMKPTRDMTPDAFKHQVDFINGMNERILERPSFDSRIQAAGLTPQQGEIIWQNYIKQRPFYDAKKHEYLGDNIGTWEDFLEPEKIKQAFSPKAQKQAQAYTEEDWEHTAKKYNMTVSEAKKLYGGK